MRHTGSKPAQCGEFLGMEHLLFEFLCSGSSPIDFILELDGILLERFFKMYPFRHVGARDQDPGPCRR